jgi:hypothetical protein
MPAPSRWRRLKPAHTSTDLLLPTIIQILPRELKAVILTVLLVSCSGSKPQKKKTKRRGTQMKKLGFATVLVGGLTAAVLGVAAPAGAAPTGPGNAQETINQLQADGYNVIVNRVGATPLDQATVVAVRQGQTYSRTDSGTPGDSFGTTITGKTVYVDVK